MSKLIIMRGFPASGKTTRAKEIIKGTRNAYRFSLDDMRGMVSGSYEEWRTKSEQDDGYAERLYRVTETTIRLLLMDPDVTVVYDAQNVDAAILSKFVKAIDEKVGCEIETCDLDVPLDTLIERNRARGGSVPDGYIRHQYRTFHDTAFAPIDELRSFNLLKQMRINAHVKVREVDGDEGVFACNFTRDAFHNRIWNEYTSKARGLFLDRNGDVVMRGFDKFFNLGENPESSYETVMDELSFPAFMEDKENGFLGIIGTRDGSDGPEFRFFTKSGNTPYSQLVRENFERAVPPGSEAYDTIRRTLHDRNASMMCEVVDMESDRHIIAYPESCIYMLHVVKNGRVFETDRDALSAISSVAPGLLRPRSVRLDTRGDVERAIEKQSESLREGGVLYIPDKDGNYRPRVKVKSEHYRFVKSLRAPLKRVVFGKDDKGGTGGAEGDLGELVRSIADNADRSRLTYTRKAFGTSDVDMTYVAEYLLDQGISDGRDCRGLFAGRPQFGESEKQV